MAADYQVPILMPFSIVPQYEFGAFPQSAENILARISSGMRNLVGAYRSSSSA